ncbi:HAD-IIIA family hydrolase [Herbaspirillum seropedicae]|uniref:Phosphoglycolate phosphatase protein n=1 Tax=Herbaspirillum seropedicae (strain SmR1) TaxID=757424 RepID=D8IRS2_HERSS|nr:HAD-IIIA family hydrolase [Herbaspirillum seropedicae]ADJ63396.1 phosphoglycolate phosphatase protein [Herbaspirillum seropedicae SmR1]AKN65431.1 HAD family hydrolase [Herbaspirillum seropedicae]AON54216.1 phosphoglycolate phosphatase [Herbaspirillum seropedicae]MDR6394798.1 phosphoglycolate phosphatase [Herbaspirillum seropedicae]NQE28592.1 HAD family hydrolase [Herbaspirillum seropedicae]
MARKQFDLIVFDWDGTLMDSTSTIVRCIQAAARDLGLPIPDKSAASYVIGLGLQDAMQAAIPDVDPKYYPRIVERYRHHYLGQDKDLTLFEGVPEMLADLSQQGYFLAVATGKSRVGLNRAMNTTGLLSMFDASRCADETFSKPHPAMLQELTRELGQDMHRTLMIGDTTHDLQMAINAGAAGVAVEFGAHPPQQLQTLSPLYSARSIRELHQWLCDHA